MVRTRRSQALVAAVVALLLGVLAAAPAGASRRPAAPPDPLPIVFVHGQTGSAQQFETQAMRFTSNGYPQDLLFAFEYDTNQSANPLDDLDAFLDGVLAETGAEQVYAIGHSRGTSVWTEYLEAYGGDEVAKYVNIDGRDPADLPGGVPAIGIWGEWNTAGSGFNRRGDTNAQYGPDPAANFYFADKSHTETATSAEAFAVMYPFLTGRRPITTDVTTQRGRVSIAGRTVLFPENAGYAGSTVEVWRIDPRTGQRRGHRPGASFPIDETGDFGPVRLSTRARYEFHIVRPTGESHHLYFEPFLHDDHFLRLNTSLPGGALDAITPDSPETTNLVILRMREMWGDQGADSDQVLVDNTNVVLPNTSPRSDVNLVTFVQDDGLDGQTDLGKGVLFPFNLLGFLTAVDVSIPASPDASGTVAVTEIPRGGGDPTVMNVPNWPSTGNALSVQFRDYEQPERRSRLFGPRGFFCLFTPGCLVGWLGE